MASNAGLPGAPSSRPRASPTVTVNRSTHQYSRQGLQFCLAEQPGRVAFAKKLIGRLAWLVAGSFAFKPIGQNDQRLVTHRLWSRTSLAKYVHDSALQVLERQMYSRCVTEHRREQRDMPRHGSLSRFLTNSFHPFIRVITDAPFDLKQKTRRSGERRVIYASNKATKRLDQALWGAGCCCVRQWMLPPPSNNSRPGTITTSCCGKRSCRMALACASIGSSKLGAMMPPLTIRKFT